MVIAHDLTQISNTLENCLQEDPTTATLFNREFLMETKACWEVIFSLTSPDLPGVEPIRHLAVTQEVLEACYSR